MNDIASLATIGFDRDEIERRKQLTRDLWAGKPLDHVPVYISVENPCPRYSIRQQLCDADKQWAESLAVLGLTWKHVPQSDLVPAVRPDVGCSPLATAFGAELYWGQDENQTCGVKTPPLGNVEEAYAPGGAGRRRRTAWRGHAPRRPVCRSGPGAGERLAVGHGRRPERGHGSARRPALYTAMYENPEALECLLGKIQQLFLAAIAAQIEAAGGQDRITNTDFPEYWFPEGRKGHVSDDISANISPACYGRFSRPFHDLVFQRYGGGGLHNCGPNPCLEGYLSHDPPPRAIDLSYQYSKVDFPRIKRLLKKRAFVYLGNFPLDPAEAIEAYRQIMEHMTPDVIIVPHLSVPLKSDPPAVYRRMRTIAEEYAKRMDWGWA